MHNFYPTDVECLDLYTNRHWGSFRYYEIWKKMGPWHKKAGAHSGYGSMENRRWWWSLYPFYHYNWVKQTRQPFGLWRDQCQLMHLPRYDLKNPIPNWRNLE